MKIANYTTTIDAQNSVMEIMGMLARSRAEAVMTEFENGQPIAISFRLTRNGKQLGFRLPSDWRRTLRVINADRSVPSRFKTNAQAQRVSWRIVRDWLRAQLSLIEIDAADAEQVFMPYAVMPNGQTLYEQVKAQNFKQLALPAPKENL